MKKEFFDCLLKEMKKNKDIYMIFIDLGWPRVDEFLHAFPDRAITVGAAEQTALDIAVGLAYESKVPFVYTITPFLFRGFETIRTYINHEKLNVKMIGAGRDEDYSWDHGFSHDAKDVKKTFDLFENIVQIWPDNKDQMEDVVKTIIKDPNPNFLSLGR